MRTLLISLVLALCTSVLYAESAPDLTAAKKMSLKLRKPVFINWGGSNCPWCEALNQEVLRDKRVSEMLDRRCVRVYINADEYPEKVTNDWNVHTMPTLHLVRRDWKLRKTLRNTLDPQDFIEQVSTVLNAWEKSKGKER